MSETFLNGRVSLHAGDSREVLKTIPDNSIDSIVTDPPYALVSIGKRYGKSNMEQPADKDLSKINAGSYRRLARGFMGQKWDTGETAFAVEFWQQCLRVLKPGGHVVAFSGTRTFHRMAVAIEDAGFEIRDQIGWAFGQGFPKSHDVSKGIDRAAGAERERILVPTKIGNLREQAGPIALGASGFTDIIEPITASAIQWQGWGTALKPAWEPICLARKPLSEKTVAANVLRWGTGAINVDGCRVEAPDAEALAKNWDRSTVTDMRGGNYGNGVASGIALSTKAPTGRFPANILHDGSDEVIAAFPESKSTGGQASLGAFRNGDVYGKGRDECEKRDPGFGDDGSAARFFYTAKADADDRLGSKHPTVKPVDLMQWLCRLVTPKYAFHCFECEENNAALKRQSSATPPADQVPGMRDNVRSVRQQAKSGQEVLQPHLQQSLGSEKQSFNEGVCNIEERLPPSLDAEPSPGEGTERIHLRTSLGSAAADWSSTHEGRGSSPPKRHKNGQSTGKFTVDDEGRARRFELAKAEHTALSSLRGVDNHESSCSVCGAARLLRRGIVFDPFSGTGTTGEAAFREGFNAVLIEREQEYQADIRRRMALVMSGPDERKRQSIKAKLGDVPFEPGSLFADVATPLQPKGKYGGHKSKFFVGPPAAPSDRPD